MSLGQKAEQVAARPARVVRDQVRFLSGFVRDPGAVGAVAPSSLTLARAMVDRMGLDAARVVVELGPGTGAFTATLLERVRPDARVIAVEINPSFAHDLRLRFPRLEVLNDSAVRLPELLSAAGVGPADCVLSGLPWALFPEALQTRVLGAVTLALAEGGRFATFAYLHAAWLGPGRRLRALLRARFARVERSRVVWSNLPPAFVYRCVR